MEKSPTNTELTVSANGISADPGRDGSDKTSTFTAAPYNPKADSATTLERLQKDVEELERGVGDLKAREESSTQYLITILGVFVAIFSFISVEFQIFRSFSSWRAALALSLILLGSLLSFVVLLKSSIMGRVRNMSWLDALFFIFAIGFIAVGVYFFDGERVDNGFMSADERNVREDFADRDQELQKNITDLQFQMKDMENSLELLKARNTFLK